jgi:hypothetical protein
MEKWGWIVEILTKLLYVCNKSSMGNGGFEWMLWTLTLKISKKPSYLQLDILIVISIQNDVSQFQLKLLFENY